jgi:hypothetical protein
MSGITDSISDYYRDVIAPQQMTFDSQGMVKQISPLTQLDFLTGSGLAILFLVQKIAFSLFFLLANIFTLAQNQNLRVSFSQNAQEGLKYAGAIPLGWVGFLIPNAINASILHIPANGLIIQTSR